MLSISAYRHLVWLAPEAKVPGLAAPSLGRWECWIFVHRLILYSLRAATLGQSLFAGQIGQSAPEPSSKGAVSASAAATTAGS